MGKEYLQISDQLKSITNKYCLALKESKDFDLGFNVFSLISDTYYKENFHSKIIAEILHPQGKHKNGPKHLDAFIEILKDYLHVNIDKINYKNANVQAEYPSKDNRRIDILIYSKSHAIIIENKINNALDQDNQIVDYYLECKYNLKLQVDLILYLTIDGNKRPDTSKWRCDKLIKDEINEKLKYIKAYTTSKNELSLYNWIEKCHIEPSISDSYFVLNHYQKLLKSLGNEIMVTNELEEYFEYLNKNLKIRKEIENLLITHQNLIYYYPTRLQQKIKEDNELSSCYSDSKLYAGSALLFSKIFKDEYYYLKATFRDDKSCEIKIMDNEGKYKNHNYLTQAEEFTKIFNSEGFEWTLKKQEFDLLSEFDSLVLEIKKILMLTQSIGEKWVSNV